MTSISGEIYFIAEKPISDTSHLLVKIGLVRASKSRDSLDRLADHQTGNPRKLELIAAIHTARVSLVERSLHRNFSINKGFNEWFTFTREELNTAIAHCRATAAEQVEYLRIDEAAELASSAVKDGTEIPPTRELLDWHNLHGVAKSTLKEYKELETLYKKWLRTAHGGGFDVGAFVRITQPRQSLDAWLKKHHPQAHGACSRVDPPTNSFYPADADAQAALTLDEADFIAEFKQQLDSANPRDGCGALHEKFLAMLRPMQFWQEQLDLALAHLKVLSSPHSAVTGVCKWRHKKGSSRFDKDVAADRYPHLVEEHAKSRILMPSQYTIREGRNFISASL